MSAAAPMLSGPAASPSLASGSTMSSPTSVPQQLQSHFYEAFLSGETSDISLRVSGSWNAIYRLHRLVLTQAGFFRSLFTSGFLETSRHISTIQGEVAVRFDHDPNITRPAFEYILARLYGGGPPLYLCPTLQPTISEPLTAAYMRPRVEKPAPPKGYQSVTPRFLLSLLSTAFHLSVPSVASEVLGLILSSIGPTTVVRYLDYATGKGIGQASASEPERIITLENIGEDVDSASVLTVETETTDDRNSNAHDAKHEGMEAAENQPTYLYGVIGNKIGEACATFLTRWGVDLLEQEEQNLLNSSITQFAAPTPVYPNQVPGTSSAHASSSSTITWRSSTPSPRIWSHGLSAEWVRGIISSDEFFVRNERTRFEVATRVVEMHRRLKGVNPEEEKEWVRLFEEGLYYSHFTWDELFRISEERSLITGKPFVSLSYLQKAHWSFSTMRQMIVNQRNPPTSQSDNGNIASTAKGMDLGLSVLEKDIQLHSTTEDLVNRPVYWPVPSDTSLRLGDPGVSATSEELFNQIPRKQPGRRPSSAQNFFGIGTPRQTTEQILSHAGNKGQQSTATERPHKWISKEPFRFSVEFWGVESLKEKTRLYSHTIWYAGSCYNVYTQAVRKKGLQLGIYLQRQSNVDPIPVASAPRTSLQVSQTIPAWTSSPPSSPLSHAASRSTTSIPHARSMPTVDASPRNQASSALSRLTQNRSTTPMAIPRSSRPPQYIHSNSSFSPSSPAPGSPPNSPQQSSLHRFQSSTTSAPPDQPYRDPRAAISAYFSISCHSTTGSSLTRFSSAPDTFAVSQSWGWKSSSLDVGASGEEQESEELSLRATVVLGLV